MGLFLNFHGHFATLGGGKTGEGGRANPRRLSRWVRRRAISPCAPRPSEAGPRVAVGTKLCTDRIKCGAGSDETRGVVQVALLPAS